MNEYEKLDALYQRDQGIGVPYPESDTNVGYKTNNSTIQPLNKKQLIERLEDYLDDDAVINFRMEYDYEIKGYKKMDIMDFDIYAVNVRKADKA
ncbi:hypothetical protein HZY86_01250 [Aerococcaceae bacterium DSM 111020]|nr:hypothetical protein [Aerococcaceae bacterium DSM 111020]